MKLNYLQPLNKSSKNKILNSTINSSSLQAEKSEAYDSFSHIFEKNQANSFNHTDLSKNIVNLEKQINDLVEQIKILKQRNCFIVTEKGNLKDDQDSKSFEKN